MSVGLGLTTKMYYNSGTWGSPTWVEMTLVKSVKRNRGRTVVQANNKGSDWEGVLVGLKSANFDVDLSRDDADTTQIALETAYEAGTTKCFAFANGDITTAGTKYAKVDCLITKFDEDEGLENELTIAMNLQRSAKSANAPTVVTVS